MSDAPAQAEHAYKSGHPLKKAFLKIYGTMGVISPACKAAGIGRQTYYDWIADPGPEGDIFRKDFAAAKENAADFLVAEAKRRALDGWEEPVVSGGKIVRDNGKVLMRKRYSPTLLIYVTNLALGLNTRGEKAQRDREDGLNQLTPADVAQRLFESMGLRPESNGHNGHATRLNGN